MTVFLTIRSLKDWLSFIRSPALSYAPFYLNHITPCTSTPREANRAIAAYLRYFAIVDNSNTACSNKTNLSSIDSKRSSVSTLTTLFVPSSRYLFIPFVAVARVCASTSHKNQTEKPSQQNNNNRARPNHSPNHLMIADHRLAVRL